MCSASGALPRNLRLSRSGAPQLLCCLLPFLTSTSSVSSSSCSSSDFATFHQDAAPEYLDAELSGHLQKKVKNSLFFGRIGQCCDIMGELNLHLQRASLSRRLSRRCEVRHL
ncbi:unnamed protein product [Pleuronectes platessa]|uniref:Uncharacterized protein n=1 Tax=Pleuronectes platessa TaxID=8262 RepID=A0A9N7Z9B4_PLEPL|nr:unnamed protein product [Pleuronectes platessa]